MSIEFIREAIENSDIDVWAQYELAQNRRSDGVLTAYLYEASGDLLLAKGKIGYYGDVLRGVLENDANETISTAGLSSYNWAKVEITAGGISGTLSISDIAGETDPDTLPTSFVNGYDGEKGGYYLDSNKRTIGLIYWTGYRILYIVNCLSGTDGYIGGPIGSSNFLKFYRHAGINSNQENFLKQFRSVIASNWTLQTPATTNQWIDVTWSPELSIFCAVGRTGTGDRVMTSPDGITWTSRSNSVDNEWEAICWSPEKSLFVAVARNGTNDSVMTSPDGITWTTRTDPGGLWRDVIWSADLSLFVAVGTSTGTYEVMTSPDGITWTGRNSSTSSNWFGVAWSPEKSLLVACDFAFGTSAVMTSPDGITWTTRTTPSVNGTNVVWNPKTKQFVIFTESAATYIYSSDGITWIAGSFNTATVIEPIWCEELDFYVYAGNLYVYSATDSINDDIQRYNTGDTLSSIAWSPELGIFVIVGISGGTGVVWSSYPIT